MKKENEGQLSLFDSVAQSAPLQMASLTPSKADEPKWDEPLGLPIDLIGNEYLGGFLFDMSQLEELSPIYTRPVFRVLLSALVDLHSQKKSWSDKSFTIFLGEFSGYDSVYLGFSLGKSSTAGDLLMFFREKFQKMPAFKEFNSGSSEDCTPVFRYDKGFIVEYLEEELAGTSSLDGDGNYGSGQVIYRRGWQPAEIHGLNKSRYSKLKTG